VDSFKILDVAVRKVVAVTRIASSSEGVTDVIRTFPKFPDAMAVEIAEEESAMVMPETF
jgi:hypothetical protein